MTPWPGFSWTPRCRTSTAPSTTWFLRRWRSRPCRAPGSWFASVSRRCADGSGSGGPRPPISAGCQLCAEWSPTSRSCRRARVDSSRPSPPAAAEHAPTSSVLRFRPGTPPRRRLRETRTPSTFPPGSRRPRVSSAGSLTTVVRSSCAAWPTVRLHARSGPLCRRRCGRSKHVRRTTTAGPSRWSRRGSCAWPKPSKPPWRALAAPSSWWRRPIRLRPSPPGSGATWRGNRWWCSRPSTVRRAVIGRSWLSCWGEPGWSSAPGRRPSPRCTGSGWQSSGTTGTTGWKSLTPPTVIRARCSPCARRWMEPAYSSVDSAAPWRRSRSSSRDGARIWRLHGTLCAALCLVWRSLARLSWTGRARPGRPGSRRSPIKYCDAPCRTGRFSSRCRAQATRRWWPAPGAARPLSALSAAVHWRWTNGVAPPAVGVHVRWASGTAPSAAAMD